MTKLEKTVSGLTSPQRKGNRVSVKWTVPAACIKTGAKDNVRFDGQDMLWIFDAKPATKSIKKGKGDVLVRDDRNWNKQAEDSETIPRAMFYPNRGKPTLANAEFWVRGYNMQGGKKVYGPWVSKSLEFAKPADPKVSISYDPDSGDTRMTYTAPHPDGKREVYDTVCHFTVGGEKKLDGAAYTAEARTSSAYEVPEAKVLGIGEFRKIVAKACNRGLFGRSDWTVASRYVCHPNPPVCGKPSLVYATEGVLTTAAVRIPCNDCGSAKDGDTYIRPTQIILQRLVNSESENDAASAASSANWTDVAVDDGYTKGMSDTWAAAVSDEDKYTWYRFVARRDGYDTPGIPVQAKCLNRLDSSTSTGTANVEVSQGGDGRSVVCALSGKESDDNGYEVSWSTEADAWESTQLPQVFSTTGSSVIIKGLEEGVRYFVRARAYDLDSDGNRIYGDYSLTRSITPFTTPTAVVLSGADTIPRGGDLLLTWTYDTDGTQTEWRLVDGDGSVRYSGTGSASACVIGPGDYGDAESIQLRVELTTGGGWASSELRTFAIADPPSCELTAAAELTAQPITLTVASDTGGTVRVSVTALGSSSTGLHGDPQQFEGDTVHSGEYAPEWDDSDGRSATIELPSGLALHNGAAYLVEAVAVDAQTGLESATASSEFTVDWEHTAQQPIASATADAEAMSATVTVSAPPDADYGDRFDLYRVTADGERRIASALPFGSAVTDRLAPYTHDGQGLRYIAVTRTEDGDACISDDIEYELVGSSLRLDWGEQSLELPYDLSISDSVSKQSETRAHLDGTRATYWNDGYDRRASLGTDLIRFDDAGQQEAIRSMLQHAGSVFVRTPDGLAFAADVQPGEIARNASSALVGVSLTAVEHDLTEADMPTEADIVRPSYTGGWLDERNEVIYDHDGKFPLDDWYFIGYVEDTLYAVDPEGTLYDSLGVASIDPPYTWDGEYLYDEYGDVIETRRTPRNGY